MVTNLGFLAQATRAAAKMAKAPIESNRFAPQKSRREMRDHVDLDRHTAADHETAAGDQIAHHTTCIPQKCAQAGLTK
jgi:hypothetical protein